MDSTSSIPTESTPIRFCAHCGAPVSVLVQTFEFRGVQVAPPAVAMTCVESSCPLHLQTISADADLRLYDATASYDVNTGALLPMWKRYSNNGPETREDRKLKSLLRTCRHAGNGRKKNRK